jgi:hypothetical protein
MIVDAFLAYAETRSVGPRSGRSRSGCNCRVGVCLDYPRLGSRQRRLSETGLSQAANVRSVHITSSGTAAMSNGDVLYWSGEGDIVHTGDSQGHIEYEGCGFPIGKDLYLCSIEWVELGGVDTRKRILRRALENGR